MWMDSSKPKWLRLATADQETMFFENEGSPTGNCVDERVSGAKVVEFSNRIRDEIKDELGSDGAEKDELLALLDSPWWHLAGEVSPKPRFSPLSHSFHLRHGAFSNRALMDLQAEAGGFNLAQMLRIVHLRRDPLPDKLLEEHSVLTGDRGRYERKGVRKFKELIPDLQICARSDYLEKFGKKDEFEPLLPLRFQHDLDKLAKIKQVGTNNNRTQAMDGLSPMEDAVKIDDRVMVHLLIPALLYGTPQTITETLRGWAGAQIGILKDCGNGYLYSIVRAAMECTNTNYRRGFYDDQTPDDIMRMFINLRPVKISELSGYASHYRGRDRLKRRALIEPARMPELRRMLLETNGDSHHA